MIGARIRSARKSRRLTQVELAKRVGIEQASLSDIENEKSVPRQGTLRLLAKELQNDFGLDELSRYLAELPRDPSLDLLDRVVTSISGNNVALEVFVAAVAARVPAFEKMLDQALIPELYRRAAASLTVIDFFHPSGVDQKDFSDALDRVFFDDDLADPGGEVSGIEPADQVAVRHRGIVEAGPRSMEEYREEEEKLKKTG